VAMNLLIDIGNTRLKWGCEKSGRIEQTGFLDSVRLSRSALDKSMSSIAKPKSAWVSSVGSPSSHKVLVEWLLQRYQLNAQVVKVRQPVTGFSNAYADLDSLGVDRWVAAIGARECAEVKEGARESAQVKDIIIVDVGTAITIDCLTADNIFQGGVIYPGYRLMHDSLVGGTSGIKSEFFETDQIVGKTTSECVNSGIAHGVAGAVERIVFEMQVSIGAETQILLTGGGAQALLGKARLDVRYEPNLVLHGLIKIAALQANESTGDAQSRALQNAKHKARPFKGGS
jgi:type III pantothenate kinase